jgi:hypothetical protein
MRIGYWWERPLGRLRRRWVDNMKVDFREIGLNGMDWPGSFWLRTEISGRLL